MKKNIFFITAVLFCSFIIINPIMAGEGEDNQAPVVAENDLERYKKILELHHAEKIDPAPPWHRYLPKEAEDSRCPKYRINPHDHTVTCPGIDVVDW